jgi:hypothetical protein
MHQRLWPRAGAALFVIPVFLAMLAPTTAGADVSVTTARVDVKAKRISMSVFCPGAGGAGCAGRLKVRTIRHPRSSDTELLERLNGDPVFGTDSPLMAVRNLEGTFAGGQGTIPLDNPRSFNRDLREAAQDDLVLLEVQATPQGGEPEVEVVELSPDSFVVERELDKPVKAVYAARFELQRTIDWSSTGDVRCWSDGAFRTVGTTTSRGSQKVVLGTSEPTSLEVQSWGEGRPWFRPDLPLTGTLAADSSTTDNLTGECDAVGDGGGGGGYVPPPADCGTRPIKPTTLRLEYARPQELSIRLGFGATIEPQTPFNRCVIIPSQGLQRSSVDLPEVWLLPELNRCRRAARASARGGSSPLLLVGKGGRRTLCRDRAAELAACREAARGGSSPLFIDKSGKGKRVRYVCKEGSPHAQSCDSTSGTSSPLLPVGGKPRGCEDKDREEKKCETTLRARGSHSPFLLVKGKLGACKFTITRTSSRRFGSPGGGYNGTVSTRWKLTLVPKRVPLG